MPKVYFDATLAGRAAGKIVDLLNFSFLDKMMQMVAWSSFLVSRCQEPSHNNQCFQSQIPSFSSMRGGGGGGGGGGQ